MLNRDSIRASRRAETRHVEAIGEDVLLREFSAAERVGLLADFQKAASLKDEVEAARYQQYLTGKIIQLMLVDDNGERLYGPDEVDTLLDEMAPTMLDAVANEAMVMSGLAGDDPAKKSKGSRKKGGDTGSA